MPINEQCFDEQLSPQAAHAQLYLPSHPFVMHFFIPMRAKDVFLCKD